MTKNKAMLYASKAIILQILHLSCARLSSQPFDDQIFAQANEILMEIGSRNKIFIFVRAGKWNLAAKRAFWLPSLLSRPSAEWLIKVFTSLPRQNREGPRKELIVQHNDYHNGC